MKLWCGRRGGGRPAKPVGRIFSFAVSKGKNAPSREMREMRIKRLAAAAQLALSQ